MQDEEGWPGAAAPGVGGAVLERMGVAELEAHVAGLRAEIVRAEAEIVRKRAMRAAADGVFGR